MIVFIDRQSGHTIGVNRKVMFSFFKRKKERYEETTKRPDYLITRSPYDRFVSFYYAHVLGSWRNQDVQRLTRTKTEIPSIDELLRKLPGIYPQNDHLWPQTYAVDLDGVDLIDMDTGLHWLGGVIGQDFSTKINHTPHPSASEVLTKEHMEVLYGIYREDFEKLRYNGMGVAL